jgi:hypothetical protein
VHRDPWLAIYGPAWRQAFDNNDIRDEARSREQRLSFLSKRIETALMTKPSIGGVILSKITSAKHAPAKTQIKVSDPSTPDTTSRSLD